VRSSCQIEEKNKRIHTHTRPAIHIFASTLFFFDSYEPSTKVSKDPKYKKQQQQKHKNTEQQNTAAAKYSSNLTIHYTSWGYTASALRKIG